MTWYCVKDILLTAAAVGGFFVALAGVNAWRRQLRGKTDWELARRLLRCVYELRDAISFVRNPFISAEDIPAAEDDGPAESGVRRSIDNRSAAAYARRWSYVQKVWSNLEVERLEAEVLWGSQVLEALRPLEKCSTSITRRPLPQSLASRKRN